MQYDKEKTSEHVYFLFSVTWNHQFGATWGWDIWLSICNIYYVQSVFIYIYTYVDIYLRINIHTTDFTVPDVKKHTHTIFVLEICSQSFLKIPTLCRLEAYWHYECEEPKGKSKSTKAKAKACDPPVMGDTQGPLRCSTSPGDCKTGWSQSKSKSKSRT